MEVFLSYCKKQLKKQRVLLFFIILLLLLILYLLWGPKVINYMKGPENIDNTYFQETTENHTFFSINNLENRYARIELHKINAGFADTVKGSETTGVYYLYPINKTQYIVFYADKNELEKVEKLYYDEQQENEMPLIISGGFQQLNEEVKKYAFTYLHDMDSDQYTTEKDIEGVILPYIFVSNHLNNTSIFFIQTVFYGFVCLLIVGIGLIIVDIKFISIGTTLKSINKLSENNKKIIDKEFIHSVKIYHFKIGEKLLFYEQAFQYTIIDYHNIVWMYQQKSKFPMISTYFLWIYQKDGTRKCFRLGNSKNVATKIINKIHHGNKDMLIGYQVQLHDKYKISNYEFLNYIKQLKEHKKGDKNEKV